MYHQVYNLVSAALGLTQQDIPSDLTMKWTVYFSKG